ncbi:MAG: CapA family protein [Clostridia bacterium]|nr:CapA family protein [Clostridia bacterium]
MKLIIGADLVPADAAEPLFIAGDGEALFGDLYPIMKGADRLIVNLECALTTSENAIKKCGPNIKADPGCAAGLAKIGVTDVMLSNNHTFDFGIQGLRDTMANLERAGIPYTGVGENDTDSRKIYYIEGEGKKIAFVNVCEHEYCYALPDRLGTNPYDPYLTMHDIREAKKNADFVIVIYHGGKEFCHYPSPRLQRLCHEMIECGASVVLTQHSHCVGCYEEYEGGHILYGQGNLHFAQKSLSWSPDWTKSLLVELEIEDDVKIKFYPITMDVNTGHADLAKGERADEIMKPFFDRNEELKDGRWLDGWRAFCAGASQYAKAIGRIYNPENPEVPNEVFAHYLDCEAHADVWREKFKTWHHTNEC